jgi:hypothetical protein
MGYSDAGWLASHIDIVRHTQMYAIKHLACLSRSATINSDDILIVSLAHYLLCMIVHVFPSM